MTSTTNLNGPGDGTLRSAALRIFGSAAAASVLLFAAVSWLATDHYSAALPLSLFAGTIGIAAISLFRWQRVTEARTAKLLEQITAAEQSRDAAVTARAENERLLAAMTHEIRTPLNGVVGMLNLLAGTTLTAEQKNYVQTADASGRTLLSIVDEILDTAKGRATGDQSETGQFRATVESVTELLAARAHAKAIEISSYVAPDVPDKLPLPDTQLRQILFNLAGNAVKFTQTGGVAIECILPRPGLLRISIIDSGIGMTASERRHVFDDFRQANAGVSRSFGGTGLGLGIARRIITTLGGTIDIADGRDGGTAFIADIPTGDVVVDAAPAPLTGQAFTVAMAHGVVRAHLVRMLEDLGATVRLLPAEANLGAELRAASPGFKLVADTTRADALRRWAQGHRRRKAPLPAVWTVLAPEERRNHTDLLAPPFAGYLLKPARRSTLLMQIAGLATDTIEQAVSQLRTLSRSTQQKKPLQVLLADDSPVNRLLTRTMLEKAGHIATMVGNGQEALDLIWSGKTFDLLLLDIEMPVLGGYETAQQLRAFELATGQGKRLPVLGLTAHTRPQDLAQCITSGMDGYLTKPFDQHDLAEAISRFTARTAA